MPRLPQRPIRAAILRGGTSRGVFLHQADLPAEPGLRDRVILTIFGSPDPRQIDGLGGADPLTSKVAIVAPSGRDDSDVDYTVGYVGIDEAIIDYEGNCGNLSQAVGPFAVDEGLVAATEPITRVRIFNTNTGKRMLAEVPVRDGRAVTEGDETVHGVPGTGARVLIRFLDASGSKTGRLLPTGNVVDSMRLEDGSSIEVSLVDAATPAVFVRAADIGLTGIELPQEAERDPLILQLLQQIRIHAALRMGLATGRGDVSPAVPKVAFVGPPSEFRTIAGETISAADYDLAARTLALGIMHKAYAVTGGLCLSAAACIEGTVVHQIVRPRAVEAGLIRVGHPSGVSSYAVEVESTVSGFEVRKAAIAGTARRIMDGTVYVPGTLLEQS